MHVFTAILVTHPKQIQVDLFLIRREQFYAYFGVNDCDQIEEQHILLAFYDVANNKEPIG